VDGAGVVASVPPTHAVTSPVRHGRRKPGTPSLALRRRRLRGYHRRMEKNRLEAFSDGVLAIIITIMVLDLKVPHGSDLRVLRPLLPVFLTYVLSFLYLGIYWNNHHHLLKAARSVTGAMMWANLHLLFWLSLFPFVTGWMGENHFTTAPTALYGVVLLLAAVAYYILQNVIIVAHGRTSPLATAIGRDFKGKVSPALYAVAIAAAFVRPWVSGCLYVFVALLWLIPDRRLARAVAESRPS
jgi:TMEM175 potassium channel family protein